jgi:hypothetical protein
VDLIQFSDLRCIRFVLVHFTQHTLFDIVRKCVDLWLKEAFKEGHVIEATAD